VLTFDGLKNRYGNIIEYSGPIISCDQPADACLYQPIPGIGNLIRNLHGKYENHANKESVYLQIRNLRLRLRLIRLMQWFGILSLFLCVLCMFFIYEAIGSWANIYLGEAWFQ
jgi:hypothetical protein